MTSISSALFKFFKARQMVEFNVIFRANKLAAGCSGAVTSTTRCGRVRNYSGIYWLEVCPSLQLCRYCKYYHLSKVFMVAGIHIPSVLLQRTYRVSHITVSTLSLLFARVLDHIQRNFS